MSKIAFTVSARTALLIGQQNFTNAEGAIIELVKNAYDADAKCCLVIFDIPFVEVPETLTKLQYLNEEYLPSKFRDAYVLNKQSGDYEIINDDGIELIELRSQINAHFLSQNAIYIIDNGAGMTEQILTNQWMTIGTGNKEQNYLSVNGRIQTGAKGIGRFALDRLGAKTELWTFSKSERKGLFWEMNWHQFEKAGSHIGEIKAELIELTEFSFSKFVGEYFRDFRFVNEFDPNYFDFGTAIRISDLRDTWFVKEINSVNKNLESLIPPKELQIPFEVFHGYRQNSSLFGKIETAFFNDFEYKIDAKFNADDLTVDIELTRNELELKLFAPEMKRRFELADVPYDFESIRRKEIHFTRPVAQILKWTRSKFVDERLRAVGDFTFVFYYLKNTNAKKSHYPYKTINSSERTSTLNRFGGIKIYRDSFRVRPYGDPGNDWVELGKRAAKSPAGAGQRVGDWRVTANQVAGIINISRIDNQNIIDKSDRGALVENDAFELFKKIVTGIINEFEYDRSRILHPFFLYEQEEKKRLDDERIQREAQKIAEQLYQAKLEEDKVRDAQLNEPRIVDTEPVNDGSKATSFTDNYRTMIEDSLRKIVKPEEKDAELAQVRNLASLGLITSSFAHELKNVGNNSEEILDLYEIYTKIADRINFPEEFQDGLDILDLLKADIEKIVHWVSYSLTAIKKDKRKRKSLSFKTYFQTLSNEWEKALADRNIRLEVKTSDDEYEFKAFEMDMNTIFSNLISNSIDSFANVQTKIERTISLNQLLSKNVVQITYKDNGSGLPDVFVNKEDIFLPFTTSKKDKDGVDIGTGLGMYLVHSVIIDNNGTVNIIETDKGFELLIEFPVL